MKKIVIGAVVLIIAVGFFLIKPYYALLTQTLRISLVQLLINSHAAQTIDNQTNIVILGIGGANHDGPNLSDSITVLNYNFTKNTITTIGIPRDIWSSTLQDKINSAYAYGEAKQPGGGLKLAEAEVGAIVGLPIEYGVVIDFDKFKELIDYLGGIDITVQHSFTDTQYPIDGKEDDPCGGDPNYRCRYETLHFDAGKQHMDGATALKFVRSRHAQGEEGSDFARSQRQQLVIAAVKEKVLALVKKHNTNDLANLYKTVDQLVKRDITNQQAASIAKNIVLKGSLSQKGYELPQTLFQVPNEAEYNGMYVLIPQDNWDKVHTYVVCLITSRKCSED